MQLNPTKIATATRDPDYASSAFYATVLGTLRTLVREEIANDKQEHADREDWSTKPFWIMFGLSGVLVIVGAAYTVVAWRQLDQLSRQARISDMGRTPYIFLKQPDRFQWNVRESRSTLQPSSLSCITMGAVPLS